TWWWRSSLTDERAPMNSPHEALFRHTFAVPVHAAGLLRAVLPAALAAAIDWSTLQPCPTAMAGADLRRRAADLLHAARFTGSDAVVGFLLEHKSSREADTGEQLLDYVHGLRREWPDGTWPLLGAGGGLHREP